MAGVIAEIAGRVGKAMQALRGKVPIVPSLSDVPNSMADKQALWKQMYTNQSPWLTKNVKSLNLAANVAAEISRLITLDIVSHVDDEELDAIYQREIMRRLRNQVEYGLALGGFIMKPYVSNGIVRVDFAQPDEYQIVKAASDGTILEIFFKDYLLYKKLYYVRVEYHKYDEVTNSYYINNKVYKSDEKGTVGPEIFDFSFIPQWANIEPDFTLVNIKGPLFGYFKPAISNNIDTKSSQGVSIFSRAVEAIRAADEQMSGLRREFRVKEAKQYVSTLATTGKGATPLPYLEDDYYIKMNVGGGKAGNDDSFFESYSPEIYTQQYLEALDEYKRQVEDAIGLAHGTISNPDQVAKTASEIQQTKVRTSVLISENQKALQDAFVETMYGIAVWLKYPSIPAEHEVITEWDDSTWMSWEEFVKSMAEDVANGLVRPELYLMKKYGVSEEEAVNMMPESDGLLRGTPSIDR